MNIVGVFGLYFKVAKNVSGYSDLKVIANKHNISYNYFTNINDDKTVSQIKLLKPDLLFVIGLSQIVREPLIDLPTIGCVGFHPTKLPIGRGRAAIAWMILDKVPGASTFFVISDEVDAGPILAQETFTVESTDYAQDVIDKVLLAIEKALDNMLPLLKMGNPKLIIQDDSKATFLGKRASADGCIDWTKDTKSIFNLIRATSKPLPGAFTYLKGEKLIILRSNLEYNLSFSGVPGRVLKIKGNPFKILVKTGDGALWLTECEGITSEDAKVGLKLGIDYDLELLKLKSELKELKNNSK